MPMIAATLAPEIAKALGIPYNAAVQLEKETCDPVSGEVTKTTFTMNCKKFSDDLAAAIIDHIRTYADINITPASAPTAALASPATVITPLAVVAGGIPGPGASLPTPCPISAAPSSGLVITAMSAAAPNAGPIQ